MARHSSGGFFDSLVDEIGRGFADIRHKLVEEGWFGRQVTDTAPAMEIAPPSTPVEAAWEPRRQSFEELWGARGRSAEIEAPAIEAPDHSMDR